LLLTELRRVLAKLREGTGLLPGLATADQPLLAVALLSSKGLLARLAPMAVALLPKSGLALLAPSLAQTPSLALA
jgi:hypothetical protein